MYGHASLTQPAAGAGGEAIAVPRRALMSEAVSCGRQSCPRLNVVQ
jgi:hypothetical protein